MKYFIQNVSSAPYQNAYGELVSNELIAVIDSFPLIDSIQFEEFSEVYSRHFIVPPQTTFVDIVQTYYSDFSLMQQKGEVPDV